MKPPVSPIFNDIYFSPENGLAETRHNFLKGNDLPRRWQDQARFRICELGFGTGLNALATWLEYERSPGDCQHIDFISIEKYPLSKSQIRQALQPWANEFKDKIERLLLEYPPNIPGVYSFYLSPRFTIRLVIGDVADALINLKWQGIHAWYLDGFAPSKNPDMWSEQVFTNIARLSSMRATAASFTVARAVRDRLEQNGFEIKKKPGFGKKREMLSARFEGQGVGSNWLKKNIAVIGGGLSGCSAAWRLNKEGHDVTLFEKESDIAMGSSSNPVALINPQLGLSPSPFHLNGFGDMLRLLPQMPENIYRQDGCLHLIHTDKRAERFKRVLELYEYLGENFIQYVDPALAVSISGLNKINVPCIWLPQSAAISPKALCTFYTRGLNIQLSSTKTKPNLGREYDVVVDASGQSDRLRRIHGHVLVLDNNQIQTNCAIHYGGYVTPIIMNKQCIGSTYEHNGLDTEENALQALKNKLKLALDIEIKSNVSLWAGARLKSDQQNPHIHKENNIIQVTGHGSHGSISSLQASQKLSELLENRD